MQLYFRRRDIHDTKRLLIYDLLSLACDVIAKKGFEILNKTRSDELVIDLNIKTSELRCRRIVFGSLEDAANAKFITPGTDNPWLELQEGKKSV